MSAGSSSNNPKVSILLPTHNRADVLPFAIQSVQAQSFQDFELLIVGDGCTDNTAEIVQGIKDPRISWYDLPKAPHFGYANRNIALREARGEFIAFMAHDDLWLSDHLEQLLPFFKDPGVEIAYSRPLWVIPQGKIIPGFFNLDYKPSRTFFLEMGNQIPAACIIHRKACLAKYGYWNDQLPRAADWDMWVRIIKGGGEKNFIYVDKPTCLHFKADWHGNDYDLAFGFPTWNRLFDSGQMPPELKINVSENIREQEAVWQVMSSMPMEWNNAIRSAVRQVIDMLAFEGISSHAELQALHASNQTTIDELNTIKNSRTWKLHQKLTGIHWLQRLYLALKTLARNLLSEII